MQNEHNDKNRTLKLLQLFDFIDIARFTMEELPRYRHIPGMTPHPISDKKGHSYGKRRKKIIRLTEKDWYNNEQYLYAIDFFNFKYYWETHEVLEDLWKLEEDSILKLFLQGLIQISAAYLKWIQGLEEGRKKLSFKGLNKLEQVRISHTIFCGINLSRFIDEHKSFLKTDIHSTSIPPVIDLIKT